MISAFVRRFAAFAAALILLIPFAGAEEKTVELPVIMYHHIHTESAQQNEYVISPETLRGDLEYLSELGYETVSLAQLRAYEKGEEELPERAVMITFDDGQRSFAEYALPLLEEFDMCAVISVIGYLTDTYTENGDTDVRYAYFSWQELEKMAATGRVEIAAHTYDMHKTYPRAGCRRMKGESTDAYTSALVADTEFLEERFSENLGVAPAAFTYPYGYCCTEARDILAKRGYDIQLTCAEKINRLCRADGELLDIGRFNRPQWTDREAFFKRLGIEK